MGQMWSAKELGYLHLQHTAHRPYLMLSLQKQMSCSSL